jgi:hypothetical protein
MKNRMMGGLLFIFVRTMLENIRMLKRDIGDPKQCDSTVGCDGKPHKITEFKLSVGY